MTEPGYQGILIKDILALSLPLGNADNESPLATAQIIAGELGTAKGAAKAFSPVQM
jgi:hypothetical protein